MDLLRDSVGPFTRAMLVGQWDIIDLPTLAIPVLLEFKLRDAEAGEDVGWNRNPETKRYQKIRNDVVSEQPAFGTFKAIRFAWSAPNEGSLATASIVSIRS